MVEREKSSQRMEIWLIFLEVMTGEIFGKIHTWTGEIVRAVHRKAVSNNYCFIVVFSGLKTAKQIKTIGDFLQLVSIPTLILKQEHSSHISDIKIKINENHNPNLFYLFRTLKIEKNPPSSSYFIIEGSKT